METTPTRSASLAALDEFAPRAGERYAHGRNADDGPDRRNVSCLSPYLHAGLIGEREVIERVYEDHSPQAADKFVSEVFWRLYFKGYLEQRPSIWPAFCEGRDAAIGRVDGNSGLGTAYAEACEGRTGIAAFDVWARELVETGYLHNHARMWFASIWIFTLKLPWELGADFFLRHLMDGDPASNTLSWRWVGGLHTKGKTYMARPDNIERYTQGRPGGPLSAEGLAQDIEPLDENVEHGRQPQDLPPRPDMDAFASPYALILHDEGASHGPLTLPHPPALVIGAARPEARSPLPTGEKARDFAQDAVTSGAREAATHFDCDVAIWNEATRGAGQTLTEVLDAAGIERVALPFLPTGWVRDALWPDIEPLAADGRALSLLPDLSRAVWPEAKAGFFKVKKRMDSAMRECGIAGAG